MAMILLVRQFYYFMVQESIKHFPIPLKLRKEKSLSPADGGTKFLVVLNISYFILKYASLQSQI